MGSGLIATDSFVSWFMHGFVRETTLLSTVSHVLDWRGEMGSCFFALPLSKKKVLKTNCDMFRNMWSKSASHLSTSRGV